MCLRAGRCGVHTLFFLALVSVFSLLAVLFMCVRVCVVRHFGALPRIVNILARHTVVSSWLVGFACSPFHCFPFVRGRPIPFALLWIFFFFSCISRRSGPAFSAVAPPPDREIEKEIAARAKGKLFTVLDLRHGFHQMPLRKEDRHLTAMCTPCGTVQWTVLPMGLKNAPSMF